MIEPGRLDADLRPLDRFGRVQPRRLNVLTFMRTIPGFASRFRDVPERFYAGDVKAAEVACPCGTETSCPTGALTACEGCERIYLYVVARLMVGNSPVSEEVSAAT